MLSKFNFRYAIVFLLYLAVNSSYGQQEQIPLFQSDEPLKVRIETDMKALLKLTTEGKYQKATLTVGDEQVEIGVRPRGNNRYQTCSFPPITLNFKKTEFKDSSYNQLKKLKLVNSCKLQGQYEQYLLREYLIYKTFNMLTDYSFKVRLLELEYIDTKDKMKPIQRFGFVIEDQHLLARRKNGIIIKPSGLKDEVTQRDQMVLVSVFQYMIGNTDWQVAARQNLKLVKLLDFKEPNPYVVPYDFDYTGMVNAVYAVPADVLGIDKITERIYWGQCYTREEFKKAIDQHLDRKEEIYALYNEFEYFDNNSRSQSINYLNSFYKIIENDKSWQLIFMKGCN